MPWCCTMWAFLTTQQPISQGKGMRPRVRVIFQSHTAGELESSSNPRPGWLQYSAVLHNTTLPPTVSRNRISKPSVTHGLPRHKVISNIFGLEQLWRVTRQARILPSLQWENFSCDIHQETRGTGTHAGTQSWIHLGTLTKVEVAWKSTDSDLTHHTADGAEAQRHRSMLWRRIRAEMPDPRATTEGLKKITLPN